MTRDDRFRALWHAGLSLTTLARRFGVTRRTVSKWRARLGLPKRKPYRIGGENYRTDERVAEYRRLYWSGLTYPAIARRLDLAIGTVYAWRRWLGLPRRGCERKLREATT